MKNGWSYLKYTVVIGWSCAKNEKAREHARELLARQHASEHAMNMLASMLASTRRQECSHVF